MLRAPIASFVLAVAALLPHPLEAQATDPLSERDRAIHLLNRATYGPRPQDIEEVLRVGRAAWLDRQLHPESIEQPELDAFFARVADRPPDSKFVTLDRPAWARVVRAAQSERQLEEVMTAFWFNHFNVNYRSSGILPRRDYEGTAIRRFVFGRFEDMLISTAEHPAMLVYLDNYRSSAAVPLEPNENYARELLELHTLGVGNYTQEDVDDVARAFTGWTLMCGPLSPCTWPAAPRMSSNGMTFEYVPSSFTFDVFAHDAGPKTVLGQSITPSLSTSEGLEILRLLARQPATARHVATRLVQAFVSDDPRTALVDHLAEVFLTTNGDLREVTRALFSAEEFYASANVGSKAKLPVEFVASSLRLTGAQALEITDDQILNPGNSISRSLEALGQLPFSEPSPAGYELESERWINSGAMLERMSLASSLVAGSLPEANLEAWTDRQVERLGPPAGPASAAVEERRRVIVDLVLAELFPRGGSASLQSSISKDLGTRPNAEDRTLLTRALALALGSPEFQRK